jgi:hypothetical protein
VLFWNGRRTATLEHLYRTKIEKKPNAEMKELSKRSLLKALHFHACMLVVTTQMHPAVQHVQIISIQSSLDNSDLDISKAIVIRTNLWGQTKLGGILNAQDFVI